MSTRSLLLSSIFVAGASCLSLQNGCSSGSPAAEVHGPHGGHTLKISIDTDYEMEFTLDELRRKIVLYTYEKSSQLPHALPVKSLEATLRSGGKSFDMTFEADPRSIDPKGSSSRFSINLDQLPQQLMTANSFSIDLRYRVGEDMVTASMQHSNNHKHDYRHD